MTACRNCDIAGAGVFCSTCGQKLHIHIDPSFHDLVHDTIHEFLHLDGKIFRTVINLFRYPGLLTKEFLDGRRASYINPIRLYLTTSLLYFLISAITFGATADKKKVDVIKNDPDIVRLENGDLKFDVHTGSEYWDGRIKAVAPTFIKGIKKVEADSDAFKKVFMASVAKSLFLLLPFFALVLSLTYWRHKRRYPQFLYFSLHYHSALFAGLIVAIPLSYIFDFTLLWWMGWAWLYLVLALKRIWSDSTKRAIQRACFTLFVYGTAFSLTLGLVGLYSVYSLGTHV